MLGPEVEGFETEFSVATSSRHAVAVASGTDALVLALRALGLGPGDEVITSPFSFFATAGSIARTGATPVFVDSHANTFNLNAEEIIAVAEAAEPRLSTLVTRVVERLGKGENSR